MVVFLTPTGKIIEPYECKEECQKYNNKGYQHATDHSPDTQSRNLCLRFGYMTFRRGADKRAIDKKRNQYNDRV